MEAKGEIFGVPGCIGVKVWDDQHEIVVLVPAEDVQNLSLEQFNEKYVTPEYANLEKLRA